ncbi:MAG: 50S ribosomal protein L22 [Holosporales bacterium]|jgi:large subunit ribosomal protein L22|nr:50S ribosomal protein L22 [Holosporales bacterium]
MDGIVVWATLRNIRVSPQKLNLVAATIRQLPAVSALDRLVFSQKRVARDVTKALRSAVANASERYEVSADELFVREAFVNQGFALGRVSARAKGRAGRIKKRFSHLKVCLSAEGK